MKFNRFVKWYVDDRPRDRVAVQGNIQIHRSYVVDNTPLNVEIAKDHILVELKQLVSRLAMNRETRADIYMQGYRDALNGFEPNPPKEDN